MCVHWPINTAVYAAHYTISPCVMILYTHMAVAKMLATRDSCIEYWIVWNLPLCWLLPRLSYRSVRYKIYTWNFNLQPYSNETPYLIFHCFFSSLRFYYFHTTQTSQSQFKLLEMVFLPQISKENIQLLNSIVLGVYYSINRLPTHYRLNTDSL